MRRFVTAGALALFVACSALFVACDEQPPTAPPDQPEQASEPDFTFSFPGCEATFEMLRPEGKARALFRVFDGQILAVSLVRQVRRNATWYGRYDVAMEKAWELADLVNSKLPGRLVDPCGSGPPTVEEGAAMLINEVFALAGDPDAPEPPFEIPAEALLPTGGFGQLIPGVAGTVWTNNREAAFVADAESFVGVDPVTIVLTRLSDPVPGTPNTPIPNSQAFPEAYDFSASAQLVGEADFWMCVVEPLPEGVDFFDLVIGHDLGDGESELLYPPLYQEFNGQVIDCADAAFQPVVVGSAGAPGWLQLAGTILEPVVTRILDVKPLNAMYFGGTGLGGRGGSLSPFAPVLVDEYYDLDFQITGSGQLFIDGTGVCANTDVGAAYCTTQTYPAGTEVWIDAEAFEGYEFESWPGAICEVTDGPLCRVVMDADKTVSAVFAPIVSAGYTLNLYVSEGGTVTTSRGDACSPSDPQPCTFFYPSFDAGANLLLTGVPDVGYSDQVGFDANCTAPARSSCNLVPATTMTAYADFELEQFALTIVPNGGLGGTVTSTDGFIDCPIPDGGAGCSHVYEYGTEVTLSAEPDGTHVGFVFGYSLPWSCVGQSCAVTFTITENTGDLWGWYLD